MFACNVSLSLSWTKDGMMIKDAFNRKKCQIFFSNVNQTNYFFQFWVGWDH
jgi:hypothetical protein